MMANPGFLYLNPSDCWVYRPDRGAYEHYRGVDMAQVIEDYVCSLIVSGQKPLFVSYSSEDHFKIWLNKQPNKAELAELLDLQEMVR